MNKRANVGSKMVLQIPRILPIIIALIGILIVVAQFYSLKYDVRQSEALFMGKTIIDCVSNKGIIDSEKINDAEIIKCLNINENNMDVYAGGVLSNLSGEKIAEFNGVGNEDLKPLCKYDVLCSNQKYYFLTKDSKKAEFDLFIAIGKNLKNV